MRSYSLSCILHCEIFVSIVRSLFPLWDLCFHCEIFVSIVRSLFPLWDLCFHCVMYIRRWYHTLYSVFYSVRFCSISCIVHYEIVFCIVYCTLWDFVPTLYCALWDLVHIEAIDCSTRDHHDSKFSANNWGWYNGTRWPGPALEPPWSRPGASSVSDVVNLIYQQRCDVWQTVDVSSIYTYIIHSNWLPLSIYMDCG